MRILVVEDERDLNQLIQKVLKKSGYSVDGCLDGAEAMLYLEGAQYDVVLLETSCLPGAGRVPDRRRHAPAGHGHAGFCSSPLGTASPTGCGASTWARTTIWSSPSPLTSCWPGIRVLSRKGAGSRSNRLTVADLTLDVESRQVWRGGEEIRLLPKEFAILGMPDAQPGPGALPPAN